MEEEVDRAETVSGTMAVRDSGRKGEPGDDLD